MEPEYGTVIIFCFTMNQKVQVVASVHCYQRTRHPEPDQTRRGGSCWSLKPLSSSFSVQQVPAETRGSFFYTIQEFFVFVFLHCWCDISEHKLEKIISCQKKKHFIVSYSIKNNWDVFLPRKTFDMISVYKIWSCEISKLLYSVFIFILYNFTISFFFFKLGLYICILSSCLQSLQPLNLLVSGTEVSVSMQTQKNKTLILFKSRASQQLYNKQIPEKVENALTHIAVASHL